MTQYPSFIENEVNSEFCERGKLRWDCFGQEGYRSLMDVLSRKSDTPFKSPEEIFLYFDERKKQPYLKTGQEVVNRVFKQFKDELRNPDTFCLY